MLRCPQCGKENVPPFRFCGECGATLDNAAERKVAETPPPLTPAGGERRHLTVLFCDLVGSTEIASRLDPEEWRELVAGYHRSAAAAITRYGGHVAKYLGDGVMAFFGYPEAHDNDAERAARAGLAILDALPKLNEQPGSSKLTARVGIDSGAVVVGAGAAHDADVFGEAPNIAARVQAAAEPGTVLITAATHRLVSGLFVVEERVAQLLRGIARPFELYRVVRPSGMRGRLAAAAAVRGMTPFINREEELRLLMSRWERAREGEGQVVTIVGEAGIGKSRLVQQFREQIAADPHTWLECTTAAFFQNTPFYAVTDMLQQTFHWHANQNAERRLEALETSLALAGLKLEQTVPLIALLLELPFDSKYPPLTMPPEQQRKRLLAALVAWTSGFAKAQPLVMATEDLHWADPSTLEFIQLAVEQGAAAPLMLLHTARPEFRIQWPLRSHHTQIALNRLSARHVRSMVGQVAAQEALSDATINAVVERTSGVPLFVEELTRAVLESSSGSVSGGEIPVTLHDSLMARLDRLGPAKEILQIGAVIGSEFSYELLHAVHPIPEEALLRALLTLSNSDLLYVRGIAPDSTYLFKHVLIRDAAYEALLKSRRKELHMRVARSIEGQFPALQEAHPEVLARHWTEAGETNYAIREWSKAGKQAESRNAFKEALDNYERGLAVVSSLPESPERSSRELDLRQSVIALLNVAKGYAAPETIEAVEGAIALAEKSGDLRRLANFLTSRGSTLTVSGDLQGASRILDRALELALQHSNPTNLAFVHMQQNLVRFHRGDLLGAEEHFKAWLRLFEDPGLKHAVLRNGLNVAVNALHFGSFTAWLLGRAEVGRQRQCQMIALAKTGGPFEVANSEYCAALIQIYLRNYERAESLAAHALALAEQYQLPNPAARSRCQLGWALAHLGRATEGVAMIQRGLVGVREIGTRMGLTAATSGLAEAQKLAGDIRAALETVELALQVLPDELSYRPEALRVRGELHLELEEPEEAEVDFRDAMALAQRIAAKAWELRATMSLARLLVKQGRRDEARAILGGIYNWFTEGFDLPDLKEAKALLNELSC
jgi:class 3 adenylate cyclase/tetratricopeptide (TPR) repeat protein